MIADGDHFIANCPRCGVVYSMKPATVRKYRERGMDEWDMFICLDCKPGWVRKGRVTVDEIWEAYCKDKGITA